MISTRDALFLKIGVTYSQSNVASVKLSQLEKTLSQILAELHRIVTEVMPSQLLKAPSSIVFTFLPIVTFSSEVCPLKTVVTFSQSNVTSCRYIFLSEKSEF